MNLLRNVLFFLFLTGVLRAQDKDIHITLDISGSMLGAKYSLANYGVQVISVLNKENSVKLIVGGDQFTFDKGKTYKDIQLPIEQIATIIIPIGTEIQDIDFFNKEFIPTKANQYLFIIGDGYWEIKRNIYDAFKAHYNTGNLQVFFLEILKNKREITSFENFLDEINAGKKYKVDSSKDIIETIDIVAEEITGVSSIPEEKIDELSKDCISFKTELPLQKIKILYQDNQKLSDIPSITSLEIDGKKVEVENIGNPSNEKFEKTKQGLMSSRIYELNDKVNINSIIRICFDKKIKKERLKIFPITNIELGSFRLNMSKGSTFPIDENTIGVCKDNNTAEINIDFTEGEGTNLSEGIIKSTVVNIISNSKTYRAHFNEDHFSAVIPLVGDTTAYRVESELKGYFRKSSGQKYIVKTDRCEPKVPPAPERRILPPLDMGSITLDQLNRDGKITGQIIDEESGLSLNPELFDISVENNYPLLFKDIRIEFKEDNYFDLIIEPEGYWCDCFIPNELNIKFLSSPKKGDLIDGKQYVDLETTLKVKIIKTQSWFERCKWLLVSIISSIVLLWLLLKLSRKNRFRRGAKVIYEYPDRLSSKSINPKYISNNFELRKKGLVAWINRWINPFGSEKSNLNFQAINLNMLFIASKSIKYILFRKSSFNEKTMQCTNYDPEDKSKFVKFDESSDIIIRKDKSYISKDKNTLKYSIPRKTWNDIATYRLVIGIIILFLIAYLLVSMYLLFKSLI